MRLTNGYPPKYVSEFRLVTVDLTVVKKTKKEVLTTTLFRVVGNLTFATFCAQLKKKSFINLLKVYQLKFIFLENAVFLDTSEQTLFPLKGAWNIGQ